MQKAIEFTRRDDCTNCNSSKSIECFDINNNPINYSFLLNEYERDKDILRKLDKKVLSYMQCKKCRTIFTIFWDQDREIPIPLNKHLSNIYLDKFLELYQ